MLAEPIQLLQGEGTAHLHIHSAHTHTHLGRYLQELQSQAPGGGPLQLGSRQALRAQTLQQQVSKHGFPQPELIADLIVRAHPVGV